MVDNILILAGGSGTRLWPASLNSYPKQFIKVDGEKTLLQLTVERALALEASGKITILTLKSQMKDVIADCAKYAEMYPNKIAILPEPVARNTAPAIAAAAFHYRFSGNGNAVSLILASDHLIEDAEAFKKNVETAALLARSGSLVTFGIPPTYPETGYGYIERGDTFLGEAAGKGFKVTAFMEKPNLKTAKKFIETGNYFWNSGMFVFPMELYLTELEKYSPQLYEPFRKLEKSPSSRYEKGIEIIMESSEIEELYKDSPANSIDYAVMEKTTFAAMVKADFPWNDVGSWDQFETIVDKAGGGEVFEVETSGNMVFSDIPVAMCGVDNLIVVIKNGKALVCQKGLSQKVKDVRTVIEKVGRGDLL